MRTIDIDYLRNCLRYCNESGKLYWKRRDELSRQWNSRYPGTEAFTSIDGAGYKRGEINSKNFMAHRVVWAIHYGEWPETIIDHIDGCKTNNKISNLRLATRSQNSYNRGLNSNNTSGSRGVWFNKSKGKWRAEIFINGSRINLGEFKDRCAAISSFEAASKANHGEFLFRKKAG